MCGIVGYVGRRQAKDVIMDGLSKLEYRGYDSAGLSILHDGKIETFRAVGKLAELRKVLATQADKKATTGIGHTRWATHGVPSENNAHPHQAGRVTLVHNGIIENYLELKAKLGKSGVKFTSDTDSEVAAHLLSKKLEEGLAPYEALKATCLELTGSYAFLAFDQEYPDRLLLAKYSTPLVIGVGEDNLSEIFVASDIPAILPYTRKVILLEDGDIAEVSPAKITIENGGKTVTRKIEHITWDAATAEKGGYQHFMLKEIHEQPIVAGEAIRGRIARESVEIDLGVDLTSAAQATRISIAACGTAWHASLIGKFYIERYCRIPCDVDYASEYRYRDPILNRDGLFLAVSQSGETADTLAALTLASTKMPTMAVCNVLGSSIARKAASVIYTQAGPEISVASTKAFTSQLIVLYMLALSLGQRKGLVSKTTLDSKLHELVKIPTALKEALQVEGQVKQVARELAQSTGFLFVGRGLCYPVALEGALKLKELTYIHAEGYPAGELKHGPIALIDSALPVIGIVQRSELQPKILSNLKEVESRKGKIIVVTDTDKNSAFSHELESLAKQVIYMPHISEDLSPIILTLPMQLLSYYVAVFNNRDVDQPRNLAKSVTVE